MKYYTSITQFNCGIDLHARQMYVCLLDRHGRKLVHTNIRHNDIRKAHAGAYKGKGFYAS